MWPQKKKLLMDGDLKDVSTSLPTQSVSSDRIFSSFWNGFKQQIFTRGRPIALMRCEKNNTTRRTHTILHFDGLIEYTHTEWKDWSTYKENIILFGENKINIICVISDTSWWCLLFFDFCCDNEKLKIDNSGSISNCNFQFLVPYDFVQFCVRICSNHSVWIFLAPARVTISIHEKKSTTRRLKKINFFRKIWNLR